MFRGLVATEERLRLSARFEFISCTYVEAVRELGIGVGGRGVSPYFGRLVVTEEP